ncbi:TetR/AcrR family transcriptional regulator [Vibrio diazotrophicus]|jgi:AcrR family transcriptional regulator|uniref:TetR/AcrR family transcriptional regulator n=1 Tax=Vibrio diazotrophicus TaxID=685 RepID=UPI0005AA6934|nr:TetR/AcrR family transcriptional regulator [Vibrio diazotrophicus]MCZ4371318.1 TetR/AcrR family transcriptional regulator [Vibrio diazotrophicus]
MSKKRQILVDTALELFYRNGINTIGINEILKSAGVAKRTLYTDFDSKEALILAALHQRHERFIDWLESKLSDSDSDARVIENLFNSLASWFDNQEPALGDFRGCFFINTSAEFSDTSCEISRFCNQHKLQVRQVIQRHLHSKDPILLESICVLKEGAITTAYMSGDNHTVIAHCLEILKVLQERLNQQVQSK